MVCFSVARSISARFSVWMVLVVVFNVVSVRWVSLSDMWSRWVWVSSFSVMVLPRLCLLVNVRFISFLIVLLFNGCSVSIRLCESNGEMIEKNGFFVVVVISVMCRVFIVCSSESCWVLEKWWISSMKSMVW